MRALLFASVCALAACSVYDSEYACQGYPDGIKCRSFQEVYDLTSERDALYTLSGPAQSDSEELVRQPTSVPPRDTHISNKSFPSRPDPTITPDYVVPVRSPVGVMRVLVFPWEDSSGDLNGGGYVFTEMTQSKWFVGKPATDERSELFLLDIEQGKEKGK